MDRPLEILTETWEVMRPHSIRGAFILVKDDINLLYAAQQIAADNTAQVTQWITAGDLRKPTLAEAQSWDKTNPLFESVIVQPYVLAQIKK
ncbi:DUF2288 domain-containing protein [bacterium]|nr:DUF2288 domain-containing protein [bacterium]